MSNNNFAKFNMTRNGFTLVEVMVALSIIMVGIIGAYELVNKSLASAKTESMRLTAAYLGKEGIEIVRNIRDSNYLKIYSDNSGTWDDGLTGCGGVNVCGADYTMRSLGTAYADQPLKFVAGNFFNYSSGQDTPYKRIITVNNMGDYLEVIVKVEWSDRGNGKSMTIREDIYNWWQM